jgi:alpha-beta hydrolase superfamily lysophospholipase
MKKITFLIAISLILVACGDNAEDKKELTYDEKVKEVCDCLQKADSPDDRMKCIKLQDSYHKSLEEDKRQEFLLTTNDCM